MSRATERRDVIHVIATACAIHGRKRGWHVAAELLGVTERWVKAAVYGEPIALPAAHRIIAARTALGRARVAQLRAELAQIERGLDDREVLDVAGAEAHPCG